MSVVRRQRFVPESLRRDAYGDYPLPIGDGQTISQPYMVALMSEMMEVLPGQRILEIGTGSGYQTAILSELGAEVFTIEYRLRLSEKAQCILAELGYDQVHFRVGDGYEGWAGQAPFDGVILTAAPPALPQPLIHQTRIGGHIVVPEGVGVQWLHRYKILPDRSLKKSASVAVRFVPMVGKAQQSGT